MSADLVVLVAMRPGEARKEKGHEETKEVVDERLKEVGTKVRGAHTVIVL